MNIKEILSEGLEREYEITCTAAEMDEKVSARLAEVATTANIPGFRPGKVPMSVVKARFGDQVKGEIIRTTLDDAAKKTIEEQELKLASQPKMDITSFEDGSDLVAKLSAEIMPNITIPNLAALSIDRPVLPDDEAGIKETMKRLADENRPTKKVKTKRKAKLSDVVLIDFTGRIDGKAFEGGAAQDHMLELGSNSFIPGFEDGLVGAQVGETVDVKVKFPADYQAAHLASKEAIFECLVKEIHEKGDAKIDDNLASKLGFENLDALRDAVAGQLVSQHATALRAAVKTNVFDQLADQMDFDVPPSLLRSEYDIVAKSIADSHDHNGDDDQDNSLAADESLNDEQKEEARTMAIRRVRLGLLLTEIGQSNDIHVSEEDIKRTVVEQSSRFPGQEQEVIQYYQNNPDAMQQLAGPMFEELVMDYILEMAKVTDVEITAEALYAEPAENDIGKGAKKAKSKSKKAASKKSKGKKEVTEKASSKKAAAKKKTAAKKKE